MGLIPGPGVMNIVGHALGSGRRTALAAVAGMAVGNVIAMSLSLAGIGALYLIGIGIAAILRSGTRPGDTAPVAPSPNASPLSAPWRSGRSTRRPSCSSWPSPPSSSPRAATTPSRPKVATFGLVVGCTDTLYALGAARAAHLFRRPGAGRWARRASGGVMIAAGLATVGD